MSVFNSALFVINETYADEYVKQHMTPLKVTQALSDTGLLATEPKVIRTRDELAALDPDTVLMSTDLFDPLTPVWDWLDGEGNPARGTENGLPAVVIATGEQVRAAQQALAEADREPETDDFHSSIGLWQPLPPATWEEE